MARDLTLLDAAATAALGESLADGVAADARIGTAGLTVHLEGRLGAGKTTVVRALLQRLGVVGRIKSPTFALMEPYVVALRQPADAGVEARRVVNLHCYHFDFYRFESPREWEDAGFRDLFSDAALRLVEWPEHAAGLLPAPDVRVALAIDGERRIARVEAGTARGAAWLTGCRLPEAAARS